MINYDTYLTFVISGISIYLCILCANNIHNIYTFLQFNYLLYKKKRHNRGYYSSYFEKYRTNNHYKNILLPFHGTVHNLPKIPEVGGNNNVFTIDLNPKTKPTIVGNAISLKDRDPLDRLINGYFDIIILLICKCCVLDTILTVGIRPYFTRIVELLKKDGLLYMQGLVSLSREKNGLDLQFLNDLGLRAYLGTDISECQGKPNTDPTYYVFIKCKEAPEMTDKLNRLGPHK